MNNKIAELESDLVHKKSVLEEKRRHFEELKNDVPENILEIV